MKQVLVTMLVLASIFSCKKDESKDTLNKESLSAKWTVDGTSVFKSFEFNKSGNYIVVTNTTKSTAGQVVLFGTYVIGDNNTIVLSDLGKIKISDISDNSINFSIVLLSNPDNEISITATKQKEMQTSTRTELLCRTWEMVTVNGENAAAANMELTVLFSAAGTYFVSFVDPEDENDGGLAQWKWNNEAETEFLYSWDETPVWEDEDYVQIPELTSDKLKIVEGEDIYILKPVSNIKSSVIRSSQGLLKKSIRSGFFKK